jgi:hypothetical protein
MAMAMVMAMAMAVSFDAAAGLTVEGLCESFHSSIRTSI